MSFQSLSNDTLLAPIYALLLMDDCKLLLPQQDIAILELISDVQIDDQVGQNAVGQISFQNQMWPVVCFTKQLKITRKVPDTRQVCAVISNNGRYIGVLCDSVHNIEREKLLIQSIPECMHQVDMLASMLALQEDEILYMTSVSQLNDHLESLQQWVS